MGLHCTPTTRVRLHCVEPLYTVILQKTIMVPQRAICQTLNNYMYSSNDSISHKQYLGWRSLDQRRADARLCMLYTIVHGLIAIQLPPYFQQPNRMNRHSHPLALRQIHTSVNFYKYAPHPLLDLVQWNKLPTDVVMLPTLPQFSVAVRSLDHQLS